MVGWVEFDKDDLVRKSRTWYFSRKSTCALLRDNVCPLILIAFITGNSSLEPLIEGLCAQIHVNLR